MNKHKDLKATESAAPSEDKPRPISVWLVDDDPEFRTLLARALGQWPNIHCPRQFASPNAVLSALASKTGPDVILLDVHLRGHNGVDAIRPIKTLARKTRVLMLTTFYDGEQERRARRAGAADFLLKRSSLPEIVERLRNPRPPRLERAAPDHKAPLSARVVAAQPRGKRRSSSLGRGLAFVRKLIP